MTEKVKLNKDLMRVRKERDAALHEHHLIMSERDQVHKEMEQLHDKWQDASKKVCSVIVPCNCVLCRGK